MSDHDNIKMLLSACFDGEATADEESQVQAHLKTCPDCRKSWQEFSRISSTLKTWPDEQLSPDLNQRIKRNLYGFKPQEKDAWNSPFKITDVHVGGAIAACLLVFAVTLELFNPKRGVFQVASRPQQTQLAGLKNVEPPPVSTSLATPAPYSFKSENSGEFRQLAKAKKTGPYDLGLDSVAGNRDQFARLESKQELRESIPVEQGRRDRAPVLVKGEEAGSAGMFRNKYSEADRSAVAYKMPASPSSAPVISEDLKDTRFEIRDEAEENIPLERGNRAVYPAKGLVIDPYEQKPDIGPRPLGAEFNTEQYDALAENEFLDASGNPLSTFSIDVDTASYSNIRRFLNDNRLPPGDAVRIEEMVNYFVYDYPQPQGDDPFSITLETAPCPWNQSHDLVMIGLQGKNLTAQETKPGNLVFLIDVSGSMNDPAKLPLLKSAFRLFVNQLRDQEHIAIVTYAGSAGLVLDSTPGYQRRQILEAIDRLDAGGSTAGGQGIQLAYDIAKRNFIPGGNNRVILATDGDFNVGVSSDGELVRMIEEKRRDGIYLTVLGFGSGNYKDSKMEKLADKGNGNYYYIDTINEAKKILVKELGSLLFTIAGDVKLQIEFNPAQVKAYRLIGYENRTLAKEDFNDDTKDAGELGAGHTVTAFYEIVNAGSAEPHGIVDPLKYQKNVIHDSPELLTVKLRYKRPNEASSHLITRSIQRLRYEVMEHVVSDNFRFAAAVAEFGLLLKDSKHKGSASYLHVLTMARQGQGPDPWGYRSEFTTLVEKASRLVPSWAGTDPYPYKNDEPPSPLMSPR